MERNVRLVVLVKVASAIDGSPVYSVADILEFDIFNRNRSHGRASWWLRKARLNAGAYGYVLVQPADCNTPGFVSQRIAGLWDGSPLNTMEQH